MNYIQARSSTKSEWGVSELGGGRYIKSRRSASGSGSDERSRRVANEGKVYFALKGYVSSLIHLLDSR